MLKTKGKNQTMVRQINRRLVINVLSRGAMSCTDVAKELRLSNTAVGKIIGELRAAGIVTLAENGSEHAEKVSELGRKPILYALAGRSMMTAIVNLAECCIILADITGEVICERSFTKPVVFTAGILEKLTDGLHEMCADYADVRLISVCVITFGMLDGVSGEYIFANRFENYKGINLVSIFKNEFGVPVQVINDTRVSLIAEQSEGLLQRALNAVLIQIDEGIAAAVMINGVNYVGEHGFAGEIGLMQMPGGGSLEDLAGIPHIIAELKRRMQEGERSSLPSDPSWDDVVEAFTADDPMTCAVVGESAEVISFAVKNLIHIFDAQVVICGGAVRLGEKYLALIDSNIRSESYVNRKVRFSEIPFDRASRIGGIKYAVDACFDIIL